VKINWKTENRFFIFVASELGVFVLTIIITVLEYLRLLPKHPWFDLNFKGYEGFNEIFREWLYLFVGMSVAVVITLISTRKLVSKIDLICPSCEEVQTAPKNQGDIVCKKCGVTLVPLKGFYERKK
jgi:hypothetical protein